MSVPDGPLLSEAEFDRLTGIVPDLTATQLWNIAQVFERRIVALPVRGAKDVDSSVERADDVGPRELRIGFRAE